MAEDWAADVRKYVADADDKVITAIVNYCGIALRNRDSSLVSFSDPVETGRVRENFLKKKLGLTQSDEELDGAIAAVGARMKGDRSKNRVTVYYLLLEHLGLLHVFGGASAPPVSAIPAAAAAIPVAAVAASAAKAATETADPAAYGAYGGSETGGDKPGFGWWPWLLLGLLALALIWWLFLRHPAAPVAVAPVNTVEATANFSDANVSNVVTDFAAAPAEGTVTIPTGAGVTVETRDGKPVAKVYFDTGKTDVVPAFSATASGLKAYLASHAGSTLAVSGFNDPTGNAAANAELSKNRAQAVKAALVADGIADASIELVKPADTTDSSTSNENARRVEVVVR
jgi:outer membrane protein OmpA-like peptidoglycan-associated protein